MNKSDFKHTVFSLSERLFPMVSRILGNTANAQDAIQEIMIKLWERREQLGKHPNPTGFVFLTARNYCLDVLRKKRLDIKDTAAPLLTIKSDHATSSLECKELEQIIKDILNRLPELQKEALLMRAIDGCEYDEIAAVMQLNVKHIRVLVSRARKEVSSQLEKIYDYERSGNRKIN